MTDNGGYTAERTLRNSEQTDALAGGKHVLALLDSSRANLLSVQSAHLTGMRTLRKETVSSRRTPMECHTGLQFASFWVTLISGYMSTFGTMISGARKSLGISQKALASRIKKEDGEPISAQYLNDIEHDRRNAPSELLISQFAEELRLSKDHLCLAAGTIPADVKENVAAAETKTVDAAFTAFRRAVKKRHLK